MNQPTVAVVILNYNGRKYLEKFLPYVMASTYAPLSIVVADNCSTDDSLTFVQQHFPSVKWMVNSQNEGFAGGYNWALKKVQADYYVLLNSDVEVTPGWIEPIIDMMENNQQIAACQPKLLAYQSRTMFEYAGAAGGWIDSLGYPFSRGRIFDICETDHAQYNQAAPIFWASGASLFIRSTLFHAMNGFDASFFAHQEEIDLCWRLQLAGYQIWSCPSSVVYHVGAGTLPRGGRKVFLNFRNNLTMMWKNLSWQELIWKMPFRFVLDAISAWKGLLTGDFAFFKAIFFAHMAFMKRVLFQPMDPAQHQPRPMHEIGGVYSGSIVWHYFVKKQRQFQEIIAQKN